MAVAGVDEREKELQKKLSEKLSSLPHFMTDYIEMKKGYRTSTLFDYVVDIDTWLFYLQTSIGRFRNKKIKDLDEKDLLSITFDEAYSFRKFLEGYERSGVMRKNSEPSIKRKLLSVYKLYDWLGNVYNTDNYNPVDFSSIPKTQRKKKKVISEEELSNLIDNIQTGSAQTKRSGRLSQNIYGARDLAIILTIYDASLTLSQAVGIDMDDFSTANNHLFIHTKSQSFMRILSTDCVNAINEYLDMRYRLHPASDALFISNRGQRMSPRAVEHMIRRYQGDMNITPEMLRRYPSF